MNSKKEQEELQRIAHRLKLIEILEQHRGGNHFDLAMPGSELAKDDEALDYLKESHLVGHCLSVALDALRTTRLVLVDPMVENRIRLPMIGQYPILRTALEASAVAVWLQRPDEPRERIRRSLAARWDDVIRDDQMLILVTESTPTDEKVVVAALQKAREKNAKSVRAKKNHIRGLAKAASIPEIEFNRGMPGFGPIVDDAALELDLRPGHARGVWHAISGLTHPSVSRGIRMSVVEFSEDQPEKESRARVTASPSTLNLALDSALSMYIAALVLTERRGGNPDVAWKADSTTPLPPGYTIENGVLVRPAEL